MASFLDKTTSALNEPKESVTATAESVSASLTDAQKTVAASTETVKAYAETLAPEKARDAVDSALSRGIEGANSLLHVFEWNRTEVSSGSSSSTVASRDLPVSTDNQPLLASGEREVERTTCWNDCCGVLDLIAASNIQNGAPRR